MGGAARLAVSLAIGSVLLTVCGAGLPADQTPPKTVKIVSSLPLQGPQRSQAVAIVNAIRMALAEQGGRAGKTVVEYESYDAASAARQGSDREVEAANARRAAADPAVVAYIGTLNSGVAFASIPITCQAEMVMVSPANTYPGFTKANRDDEPARHYPNCTRNYARVVPPDDAQGAAGARWAKSLGARKVYILYDRPGQVEYGYVLASAFRAEAQRVGLQEVGYELAARARDFRALASRIAASGADFLYYGAVIQSDPGVLLRDVRQAVPSIGFMGPDGIAGDDLMRQAGESAIGAYVTLEVPPVSAYTGRMREWADRYRARYGEQPEIYAVYGYEAAKVVLAAIEKAGDRADDRAAVRDLVLGTKDFAGVLGTWSFDANGDISVPTRVGRKVVRAGADFDSSVEFKDLR